MPVPACDRPLRFYTQSPDCLWSFAAAGATRAAAVPSEGRAAPRCSCFDRRGIAAPAPRMMRILLVSPYFPPRSAVGAMRVHAFARYWSSQGEDVTVLTTVKRPHQRGIQVPCDGFRVVELDYPVPRFLERMRHA